MAISVKKYTKYVIYVMAAVCLFFIVCFNFILYPIKYKKEILTYSAQFGVDRALIASVIAAESSYDPMAESYRGAIGLMQLLPTTAKWLCELCGEQYEEDKLYEAEYNIKLGTFYLNYLTNKFKNVSVAIAAYNAGEGVVSSWLNNTDYSADGVTLDKIPYKETANYLTKVNRGINIYRDRL